MSSQRALLQSRLSLTTVVGEGKNVALPNSTLPLCIIPSTPHILNLKPVPPLFFSSITSCQRSSGEPLTCHSGHWCPINENSAREPHHPPATPLRDYEERQEPSLSHLGCSSTRKTAIVTTLPPQAAPLRSMTSDCLMCLFQNVAGISVWMFNKCWPCWR